MQLILDGFLRSKEWQTFTLERDQLVVLGQSQACHIVIPGGTVPKLALELHWDGCRVLLRDMGSHFGIRVNNKLLVGGIGVLRLGHTLRVYDARFRLRVPVSVEPAWIAWNNDTVRKIAQAINADSAFERLPILADALEDAGCDNTDILNHCRQPADHVRGCWAIDLLLGKS